MPSEPYSLLNRREFVRALGTAAIALPVWAATPADAAPEKRPNIVVILADDMGFSDIGCYGGEIATPNLDQLASEGVRFTQFYNTARCCPTRACLLTGLYPHQAGIGHMVGNQGLDGYEGDLNPHCLTIAQVLKTAGYSTYMAGKWHVTKYTTPDGTKAGWPLQRGFDRYYGILGGAASYWDPGTLTRDNTEISAFDDPEYKPERYYFTDAITDHVIRFVNEHHQHQSDRPFFTYVAYTAAHWPLHAPEEEIEKVRGKYDGGYEPIRRARFERLRKMGMLHDEWELSPQAGDWNTVENKHWQARCMEVYAAQVARMDKGIGRIVEALKKNGQFENTLVLFLQDNGACAEEINRTGRAMPSTGPTYPPIPASEVRLEGQPKQTRAGVAILGGPNVDPGGPASYISYGRSWANVSNTPFREYKHWVHEGGISTPLIAHWPAGIRRKNVLETQPGHLIDIMATCVAISGAKYPAEYQGQAIAPLEGRNLVPAFAGKTVLREALFWEHEGNRALRIGNWKLVAKSPRGVWELYDMEHDRTELHDLAAAQPERTRQMAAAWEIWAKRTHALPWPWKPQYGQAEAAVAAKNEFTLKTGDSLRGANAPHIANREITIEASIEGDNDGVVVSQGGKQWGYTLYVKDRKANFAARLQGALTTITAAEALPAGKVSLAAFLKKDGTITLHVNAKQAAAGRTGGLIPEEPIDALCVGRDEHDPVGDYKAPFVYGGKILSLHLVLN